MKNIFIVGEPIYKIAINNRLPLSVCQEIAARGWSDNAIITEKMSLSLNALMYNRTADQVDPVRRL